VPLWLTVLVMSRDIGIVVTVAIVNLAVGRRTFPPSIFGKAANATFMMTAVLTLWANYIEQPMLLVDICAYVSLALTVISALHYAAYITGFAGSRGAAD
jgi:phosphatidylglycerophosphate synthase